MHQSGYGASARRGEIGAEVQRLPLVVRHDVRHHDPDGNAGPHGRPSCHSAVTSPAMEPEPHIHHPMGGRMGKVTKRHLPVGYPWDCARRDS
ncbi:MAG: hypothetical protein EBQ56_16965 [Proteobacteria bacterium]|nr:hypothetical protein [Pseudomonadota bacterium]NCV01428.1 hypothetical protein [Pseudomonadota bacterium]NDF38338.1 hypothetical protein [Pseudomonadota bacterium]HAH15723.1 hypothetical protein [Chloroflexota bacterium]